MADDQRAGPDAPTAFPDFVNRGVLEGYIGFFLRQAESASFRAFKRHAGIAQLKPGWFAVLSIIRHNPGITPVILAKACGRDKSTITPILRDLIREQLVSRAEIPHDRRSYALQLTNSGIAELSDLGVAAAAHEEEIKSILGERTPDLLGMLRRIVTELD